MRATIHDHHRGYDVLVVGAGPAGLTTAVSAARHGARVLVVERHPGTSIHPRATGVSTRTMEILRGWGLTGAVRAGGVDVLVAGAARETLAAPPTTFTFGYPSARAAFAVSPSAPACVPQDHIEPLLVARLRRDGGEVAFHTELTELHTGPAGVHARLADRNTGAARSVRARYVVGADGTRSTVRTALGIGVERLGTMGEFAQVLFRADLDRVLGRHRYALHSIEHPDASGLVLPLGPGRWGYARQWFPERGESPADFTPAWWTRLLRIATGLPDLEPELLGHATFTLAAELATAFRAGHGFLVGDAAHRTTPVAGVGMNTAVHDGHNLGWKLAWVSRGLAGAALLDSYADERGPIGVRNTGRSLRRGEPDPSDGLPGDLGPVYRSAVITDADPPPIAGYADPTEAMATPGERAPHAWISYEGRRRSTLDLFDGHLTVVTGRDGHGWRSAARQLAATGLPVVAPSVGAELTDAGRMTRAYRLGRRSAVLVRPDGYVAWRCDTAPADANVALRHAVGTALGRTPAAATMAG
jgi:putative polyketide hydroxylase